MLTVPVKPVVALPGQTLNVRAGFYGPLPSGSYLLLAVLNTTPREAGNNALSAFFTPKREAQQRTSSAFVELHLPGRFLCRQEAA